MTMTPEEATRFAANLDRLVGAVEEILLGKNRVIRLAFAALLSEGHLLLEDVPGTGKTSLARAMAQSVAGTSNRVQFTPDLLPGDITGVSVYDQRSGVFEFHPGPVFANLVLADEINRASPKTQSALLEVMEEGQVTVDGQTHRVGRPFMVIATQNPVEQAGTYRLPEAQLDRFLMKTSVGYPDREATIELLVNAKVRDRASLVTPVITAETISQMSGLADEVYVDPAVIGYVAELAEESRTQPHVKLGLSARG
ncbi:MAG TPA: AAA family ATPase, partial [Agromyces sp.]|nr:AAA family ATPase [Agromyces sp.]